MMADDIALARVMDTMAEGETGTGKELASIRLVLALVAFATLCQQPAAGESFRDFQQRDAAAFRTWQQEGSSGQQSKAASNRSPHASKGETAQQVVYAGRADAGALLLDRLYRIIRSSSAHRGEGGYRFGQERQCAVLPDSYAVLIRVFYSPFPDSFSRAGRSFQKAAS